jgi:hypothetical protein
VLIKSLNAYRNALKWYSSSLPAAMRLTRDILVLIFELCGPTAAFRENKKRIPSHVLAFSQVCRHWRTVALSTPALWSTPIFTWRGESITEVMIERAKDVPLCLYMPLSDKVIGKTFYEVLGQKSIRSLDLITPYLSISFTTRRIPAPEMTNLKIRVCKPLRSSTGFFVQIFGRSRQSLSSGFLSGHAPKLRSIDLTNCALPSSSPLYSTITKLALSIDDELPKFDFAEVVAILEHAPALERILFRHIINTKTAPLASAIPTREICLPNLTEIYILDELNALTALLKRLDYPPTARATIGTGRTNVPSPLQLTVFFDYLGSHLNRADCLGMKYMRIGTDDRATGTVHLQLARIPGDTYHLSFGFRLPAERAESDPGISREIMARHFCRLIASSLPLQDVVSLRWMLTAGVDGPDGVQREDVERMLKQMPRLTELGTRGRIGYSAIAALLQQCLFKLEKRQPARALPKVVSGLATLRLADLECMEAINELEETDCGSHRALDALVALVDRRHAAGHALDVLTLEACTLDPDSDEARYFSLRGLVKQKFAGRDVHVKLVNG